MLPPFKNEPLTDFSKVENQNAFMIALDRVKNEIGMTYPLVINGTRQTLDETFASVNPARPDEVVGYFANGGIDHADRAINAAANAFETWRKVEPAERARYLLRAAAAMRRRRHEFSALLVLEVGKNWVEADADTAEAIDFLEYYARQMLRIADSSHLLTHYPTEESSLYYIPLGVGAIIPPWNFACAIPTGMVSSALVAGNTVVFKPAEQSPLMGYKIAELFWEQDLPPGVLNFVTGPGEVVGASMVEHSLTRFVSFTGSREVGVKIYEQTARVQPGQSWLKRAILEMGGKNAVIVDETADLDAAAQGIVASAFGFQGQKCSAGSRAVIVDAVYEAVAERVLNRTRQLKVDAPDKAHDIDLGPVIDTDALDKILHYIEVGNGEGELICGGSQLQLPEAGYFVQPTIFGEVAPTATVAQEEIFGPVLALIRATDFSSAIRIANGVEYGLTGAVYTQSRSRLEQARRDFHVGNLYLNRKATGALVGVQPFGGFNMSGTDSKAGGPDYLLLFTQAKSVSERL